MQTANELSKYRGSAPLPGMKRNYLAVVIPVYEDADASSRLFQELSKLDEDLIVIAVDDGSIGNPLSPIGLEKAGLGGVILRLKRNVGHQRAIAIGLDYVAREVPMAGRVVVMDSDGEDSPKSIPELLGMLESHDVDVVVAARGSRADTFQFRVFYMLYKWLFGLLVGRKISFGNFMALKRGALERLVEMPELGTHVASCVLASKLRLAKCFLDRGARYAGQSKMNFIGLVLHGFRGMMVFAEDVLVRVGAVCIFVALLSIVGSAAAVVLKVLGFATPGWFSVALGILFMVFLQTGTLTLVTLMLTGVVRSVNAATPDYGRFIAESVTVESAVEGR